MIAPPKPLFDYDYCAACFHANHPGWECTHQLERDRPHGTFIRGICGCIEPTSEEERGEKIVTLGSCENCGHQNHTWYGACWFRDTFVDKRGKLLKIPCECTQ